MKKGDLIEGPDGQAYRLTEDLHPGSVFNASCFEPLGGAPNPEGNHSMPLWLAKHFITTS